MKYYNTSFTAFGFTPGMNAISAGNVVTNTNCGLKIHFNNLREELFKHAEKSLEEGFPSSTIYTITISIFDMNTSRTNFITIKKNILHIFKNYDKKL